MALPFLSNIQMFLFFHWSWPPGIKIRQEPDSKHSKSEIPLLIWLWHPCGAWPVHSQAQLNTQRTLPFMWKKISCFKASVWPSRLHEILHMDQLWHRQDCSSSVTQQLTVSWWRLSKGERQTYKTCADLVFEAVALHAALQQPSS